MSTEQNILNIKRFTWWRLLHPPLSPSASFHPPYNIFILFYISPSSFFMQIHANEIILIFLPGLSSKSVHTAVLYSSSPFFNFFIYSCIVFHGWIYQGLFDWVTFSNIFLSFNLFLLQTMHLSSSALCISEIVRKKYRSWTVRAKGKFVILIDIAKLLSMGVVIIYTPTSGIWTCLLSQNLSSKMCVKIIVLFILDVLCQLLIVSYYLSHQFYMQRQKFPDWISFL